MFTVDKLFSADALARAVADGHVRAQTHPTAPLTIYNYTEHCAFASASTKVTSTSFSTTASPVPPVVELDEPVSVTDKADGSLGIIYQGPDGLAVATRGSFASEQAVHATSLLRQRYAGWAPPVGLTVLVEIIYPENRIVLDYGGMDDLILLGAVEIATGRSFGPEAVPDWPGPVVESFDYPTFDAALAAPPRPQPGRAGHSRTLHRRPVEDQI